MSGGLLYVFLTLAVLIVDAKEPTDNSTDNSTAGERICHDNFCDAHLRGDSREAAEHLRRLCEPECEEELERELRVAHLNYDHVRVAFGSSILIMVVIFAKLWWHSPLMERVASNIPESCMLIVLGTFFGGIITSLVRIDNESNETFFRFSPELFFLVLLPPIVLDSGYFLDNRSFFENFFSISVYAVIGTVWNTFAIGAMLYACSELDLMSSDLTLPAALLLGTICSAVDPVAVLAVFDEIHVNRQLHVLVFGESLLNDAVTVVLFRLFSVLANRQFLNNNFERIDELLEPSCHEPTYHGVDPDDFSIVVRDGFLGFAQFVVVIFSSIGIGYVFGSLTAFTTKYTDHVHVLEPMIVFSMGYLAYVVAEMFELSGIITLITAAIVMRHFVEANLSRKSHTTLKYALKVVSIVSEMVIFLFLGLSLFDTSLLEWDTGLVLWTLLFAALFRPIGVIVLTYLLNRIRVHKVGYKEQFVLSYSGLRGAVAFALALIWRSEEGLECFKDDIKEISLRRRMLTAVTTLVMFTVFIQGTTIKPIVERMKVKKSSPTKPTMNEEIHTTAMDHILTGLEDIIGHFGHNRLRYKFQNFDVKYLRRFFERKAESRDEQILQTFHRLQYIDSVAAVEQNLLFETKAGAKGTVQVFDMTTRSPSADQHEEMNNEGEDMELLPLQDIINYNFFHPHRDHMKHQVSGDEAGHRREHLHFSKPSDKHAVQSHTRRHSNFRSRRHMESITTETEKEPSQPPTTTFQEDIVSITSDNELSLFPPISYEDELGSPMFRTTSPDDVPVVSIHYDLPELTTMETTV